MEKIVLQAEHRNIIGKHVKSLRREGKLPAVLYGRRIDPIPVALDLRETSRILGHLTLSALVTIRLNGDEHIAIIRDKQRNILTGELLHVDFQVVSMQDKIRTSVALNFAGESPAVEVMGAILVTEMDQVSIECLPGALPESITVDLSNLREIGDVIYLKDLAFPEDVDILDDLENTVAVVAAPRREEEEEEVTEAVGFEEPEVVEKGKQEDEDF
jgi:large subunit ribosomal protein L25